MVPTDGIDSTLKHVDRVPDVAKEIIEDFFRNYKNNEPKKRVVVGKWLTKEDAVEKIMYV